MKNTYMESLINIKTNKNRGEILAINSYKYSKRKKFDTIIITDLYFEKYNIYGDIRNEVLGIEININ